MYHNFIFDLYGTLVDIHTNEKKPSLWKKLALFYSFQGAAYTGQELRRRYRQLEAAARTADGLAPKEISAEDFERGLYTSGMPDPDLVIRTSGEVRLSNFLLWQVAYSEFVVTDVLWPDFDRYELLRCLLEFQGRDRRFGAVK